MPQAQAQELEELNRELRQCNLQQFIRQTGAALPPAPRPDRAPPGSQVSASGGGWPSGGPVSSRLTCSPHRISCLRPEKSPSREAPGVPPSCPV